LLFAVLLTLSSRGIAAQTTDYIYSHTEDDELYAAIRNETLANSPAWEGNAENPPISAKRAIQLASAIKESLVRDTEDWEWRLESAALKTHGDKWYWLIRYQAHSKTGAAATRSDPHLVLPVLMDGSAIKPRSRRR
jgi:hypothetical protein